MEIWIFLFSLTILGVIAGLGIYATSELLDIHILKKQKRRKYSISKEDITKSKTEKPYEPNFILIDPPQQEQTWQPPQPPKPQAEPLKPTPEPKPQKDPIKPKPDSKPEKNNYDKLVDDLKNKNNWHECYEPSKLFTENEKDKHKKIIAWANKRGYSTMGKIRLADLIKRRPSKEWNEPLFKKISQKHIDFVIVDKDLNPVLAIEIQDKSHETQNRMESDAFKKIVLESCGYKLLQTYDITDEILDHAISS